MDIRELREARAKVLAEAKSIVAKADEEKRAMTEEEIVKVNDLRFDAEQRMVEIKTREDLAEEEGRKVAERVRDDIPEGDGGFRGLGDFVRTVLQDPHDPRLRVMDLGEQPGALVPEQYATQILQVSQQASIVEPRATVIPADASQPDAVMNLPAVNYGRDMYGGVEVAWIEEADEKPETDLGFTELVLTPKEVAAHVIITDKLLRNVGAVEVILNQMLGKALAAAKDVAFMTGAAPGVPVGIIGHAGTVVIPRATAGTIEYGDLCDVYGSFFGDNGTWVCANTGLPVLMQMEDGAGHLIWQANAAVSPTGSLLGDPLLKSQRQPILGVEGDLLYADFSQYIIKEGFGLAIAKSEHVYFTRNKTVVKAFLLVDGAPWIATPLILEDGSEASPFVVLGDELS